jgi:hypothetical protein
MFSQGIYPLLILKKCIYVKTKNFHSLKVTVCDKSSKDYALQVDWLFCRYYFGKTFTQNIELTNPI